MVHISPLSHTGKVIDNSIIGQPIYLLDGISAGLYPQSMFNERLKKARIASGLTQEEVAKAVGMKQSSYNHLEQTGKRSGFSVQLATALNVDPTWLTTGKGQMKPANASGNSNLTPIGWDLGKVPLISSVQAGNWCEAVDNFHPGDAEEWLPAPARHGPHAYALRVVGTSMEPRFREGEIVVIDPEVPAVSGRFVVAKKAGTQEVTLKQLVIEAGDSYLKALNPHWPQPIIRMTEEWIVCGSVICKIEIF